MELSSPWIAMVAALFVWWFATGAILCVVKNADRRGQDVHIWSVLLGLPVLIGGVAGYVSSLADPSLAGVYIGFLSAIAIWGWIELAFLSGVITGPSPYACPPGAAGWDRFLRAWGTVAYHEILLAVSLLVMLRLSWEAPNTFGFWTFAVLFFARISAKLNLFFGVPKINVEFLPHPLSHLPSHFRVTRITLLFPFSITALTFAVACWLERIYAVGDPAAVAGFTLLTAMTALALLEHWFMVLPLPDEKLWRWMIPGTDPKTTTISEDPHGL